MFRWGIHVTAYLAPDSRIGCPIYGVPTQYILTTHEHRINVIGRMDIETLAT